MTELERNESGAARSFGTSPIVTAIASAHLILLRHKLRRCMSLMCRMQQGKRDRFRAMATIRLRRIVAMSDHPSITLPTHRRSTRRPLEFSSSLRVAQRAIPRRRNFKSLPRPDRTTLDFHERTL